MLAASNFVEDLKQLNVHYRCLEMKRGHARIKDLYNLIGVLRELKPDILASFCFHANVLGSVGGRLARVPVVITSIRGESSGARRREYIERLISSSRLSDGMVTNSSIVAKALIERGVVSSRRIQVIYNGIYNDKYTNNKTDRITIREQLGVCEDDFCWLAVGNVSVAKDYPTLLKAFASVKESYPNSQLRVAGGLWYKEVRTEVERIIEHYSLQDSVKFLDQRQDVPALLYAADAFVLSSMTEGLPNAVMEAMATGLPVVATDVGGVRELVTDAISGLVVPSKDIVALSKAMIFMMSMSVDERTKMGQAGQKHIQDSFELDVVAQQWEELFLSQLSKKRIKSRTH